jgi:hypothetical protein
MTENSDRPRITGRHEGENIEERGRVELSEISKVLKALNILGSYQDTRVILSPLEVAISSWSASIRAGSQT